MPRLLYKRTPWRLAAGSQHSGGSPFSQYVSIPDMPFYQQAFMWRTNVRMHSVMRLGPSILPHRRQPFWLRSYRTALTKPLPYRHPSRPPYRHPSRSPDHKHPIVRVGFGVVVADGFLLHVWVHLLGTLSDTTTRGRRTPLSGTTSGTPTIVPCSIPVASVLRPPPK
ncbi:hypothetical protein HPB50_007927 [Hyalomma asiaticum]|uniref:Uncharacterized protein n=1 Tax=Hyalomma asiaticum TaxID=266040 RepID=A0ACB7S4A0_HYAAI|nr:hypothetical protein HPB50_007927 [Hyalomma asiaticum]